MARAAVFSIECVTGGSGKGPGNPGYQPMQPIARSFSTASFLGSVTKLTLRY